MKMKAIELYELKKSLTQEVRYLEIKLILNNSSHFVLLDETL
jgi:hypothetical protein